MAKIAQWNCAFFCAWMSALFQVTHTILATTSTKSTSLLSLFDSHCFSPFPMAFSFLIQPPVPLFCQLRTILELATFFSFQLMCRVLIYPILPLSLGDEGGKKCKKMQNSCILFMFFTLFLQLSKLYFYKKKLCKASSKQCFLNVVFQKPSSNYEWFFFSLRDGVNYLPTSSVYKMVLFPRGTKKKLQQSLKKTDHVLWVMNHFRKSWAFEILISASHFRFVLLPKWIYISH